MEVAPSIDFNFNISSHNGSYNYTSAPSSPTRLNEMYCEFDELLIAAESNRSYSRAAVPFSWEEKPGVPKIAANSNLLEDDFSFDVSCELGNGSVPAEDLFQGGVIRAINDINDSSRQMSYTCEGFISRGRERGFSSSRLSSKSRRTRSLSPLGVSDRRERQPTTTTSAKPMSNMVCSTESVSKRWSFKDLFLFRSASDGRAMEKDPLKKYSCESGSISKRRGRVSAHELHYNLNRANSNEMKKKTYLPYKHGILGGLSFNP